MAIGIDVVRREDRMGHEEDQVHREIYGHQNGDLPAAASIGSATAKRVQTRGNRQQGELHVDEIGSEHARIQLGRRDVDAAIGRRRTGCPH